MNLPDVLPRRPRVLFVGINPSLRSAEQGHHYAGRGNPFWRLLHASGLTPVLLRPDEDGRLPEFGYGLTNLCPRPTRAASELSARERRAGAEALRARVAALAPEVVAFVGLSVYQQFFSLKASGGAGKKPEEIVVRSGKGKATVFALPNPSGLNASFPGFEDKLVWFRQLAEHLHARGRSPG